ncbi:MAG: hypothetical protein RLO51_08590 [Thalassobaculum sp.]|uniref:hypothetical protein n=1 Tax=Thalassobaculum sp. TaxID=2022740 RepID=UPI0032EE7B08
MRLPDRRTFHRRRPGPARDVDPAPLDRRASLVALALVLLLGLAAFPLLSDGRVLDNLGAGLRHWAGVNR